MAVFQAVPGVAQVEMRYTQQGQQVENVFHVSVPDVVTPAIFDTIAGLFASWFTTELASDVSTGLTLNSVIVRDLAVDGGIAIEHVTGLPASGLDATEQMPMNVTVAIKWLTGRTGRSYRGRTYHLGIVESQVDNSTVKPIEVTSLFNIYTNLLAATIAGTYPMVVVSRRHAKAVRPLGIGTLVTGVFVDNTIDSQRRRLPGRGR